MTEPADHNVLQFPGLSELEREALAYISQSALADEIATWSDGILASSYHQRIAEYSEQDAGAQQALEYMLPFIEAEILDRWSATHPRAAWVPAPALPIMTPEMVEAIRRVQRLVDQDELASLRSMTNEQLQFRVEVSQSLCASTTLPPTRSAAMLMEEIARRNKTCA